MSEQNSKKIFYRLRSLKSIFEYKELENQEIYFASLDELNDPMENSRDIIFQGSKEQWNILFRKYLWCYEWAYLKLGETRGKYDVLNNLDDMCNWIENGTTTQFSRKILKDFMQECDEIINKISTRTTPINKDELLFYLEHISLIAIKILHKYYNPSLEKMPYQFNAIVEKIAKKVDEIEKCIKSRANYQECLQQILDKNKPETRPMYLNFNTLKDIEVDNPLVFALPHFSYYYLLSLENILYSQCYVACFMEETHNSSVWAHYAENHRGICLMFETINQSLTLNQRDKKTEVPIRKVEYGNPYQTINLLGLIKDEIPIEEREKLHNGLFVKTKDWSYEKEYRIVANNPTNKKMDKKTRKLKYDFRDLHGIIFGMRTSLQDKIKIINIIKQKCKTENRQDFKFYEAYYCQENNNIQYRSLLDI